MLNANTIKLEFIKWLLKKEKDIILGNEVLFSIYQKRADLLMIKKNKTYAYEIKSDRDNLKDIQEQLSEYLSSFDYTTLIITPKFEKNILNSIDNKIGIYVIDNNKIRILKRPLMSRKQDKNNLLQFLHKNELTKLLNKKGLSKYSVFDLRKIALKEIPIKLIKELSTKVLYLRYSNLFNLFVFDTKGENITIDDLKSLTGNISTNKLR